MSVLRRPGWSLTILTLAFLFSRVVIDRRIPFNAGTLNWYMQFLDPEVLRDDLLRGLSELHVQPPLFNLFLGLFLRAVPSSLTVPAMATLYTGIGLAILLGTWVLMRRCGVTPGVAVGASVAMLVLPSLVDAERWLFYAYPLALTMVVSALLLYRSLRSGSMWSMTLFLGCLASVVLMRSFYSVLLWMLPVVAALLWHGARSRPSRWRLRAVVALGFLVLAASPSLRNVARFGVFSSSTFQGMNVAAMTRFVPTADVEAHVREGLVTPLAQVRRFSAPEVYLQYYGLPEAGEGEPLRKSTGFPNWNHSVIAQAAKEYQANALRLILRHPIAYATAVSNQAYIFFGFSPYRYFGTPAMLPGPGPATFRLRRILSLYVLPPVFAVLYCAVTRFLWSKGLRTRRWETTPPVRGVCLFMAFNLSYALLFGSLLELGEGCYLRIPVDPLFVTGLAMRVSGMIGASGSGTWAGSERPEPRGSVG